MLNINGIATVKVSVSNSNLVYSGQTQKIQVELTEVDTVATKDPRGYTVIVEDENGNYVYNGVPTWELQTDGKFKSTITVEAKDAGDYTAYMLKEGDSATNHIGVAKAFTIAPANLENAVFELTSDRYEAGKAPELKSVTIGGVDYTDAVKSDTGVKLQVKAEGQWGGAEVTTTVKDTKYITVLTCGASTNFTGYTTEANAEPFTAYEATLTDSQKAFKAATALEGIDQDGKAVQADDKGKFTVVKDGSSNKFYVVPTSVMPEGGKNAVEVELLNEGGIDANVFATATGGALVDLDTFVGTCYVAVKASEADSVYAGAECYVPLVVKAHAFDSVEVFNKDVDNDGSVDSEIDVANTEFVYGGLTYNKLANAIGFSVDGKAAASVNNLKLFNAAGQEIDLAQTGKTNPLDGGNVAPAGAYTVNATVDGTEVTASFTLEKLDLSKSVVIAEDLDTDADYDTLASKVKVNDKTIAAINATFTISDDGLLYSVSPAMTGKGAYKVTVSANPKSENVTGSKTAEFNVVEDLKSNFAIDYDGSEWTETGVRTFKATGSGAFDASLVAPSDSDYDDYTVTVLDDEGKEVEGDLVAGEEYSVVVRLVPNSDFEVGGSVTKKIKVQNGEIDSVSVTYKGDVVNSGKSISYTGKDVMGDFEFTVKDGKKVLIEGTDYELVIKQGSEVVEEAVESGKAYTVEVKGLTYAVASSVQSFSFTIGEMDVNDLDLDLGDKGVVAWTGKAVEPVVLYTTDSDKKIDAGTAEYSVLPADFYVAKYYDAETDKAVSEVVDEGEYYVVVTPSTKIENMTLPTGDDAKLYFTVSKTVAGFVDVSTSAWYADVVAKANSLKYMTGISGTAMFAPNATITRAEVAEVFSKMAKIVKDDSKTYPTKFADVEADAWYAQAIAWASQAGIVGGYEGTDVFGTFDNATREQIATMIYRYAAVAGMDTSVEDEAKALASYKDAGQLTFGKTAMAWCVEQGIMGVDTDSLRPGDYMSRAEMAATAVRVQPEAIA